MPQPRKYERPAIGKLVLQQLGGFSAAEKQHQDYSVRHRTDAYVVRNDIPKLEKLKKEFPDLYSETRVP